ncbi:hypothetical protein BHE74_00013422 [Ensete ventricosum]|nr:hypothetical protein GW17_00026188 [Ensete ventricosum]RWW78362.1 hypothetical protein BHE74_00013422 [Ensete ventricosum]RZR86181.1 hypothetical protein BHM03_00013329 [Ensete ventricosum]
MKFLEYTPLDRSGLLQGGSSFIDILMNAIDECRWAFNFFFYNRKLKRVVSFRCCCFSKLAAEDFVGNDVLREEEDLLDDMEM